MIPEYQSIPPNIIANLTAGCASNIGSIAECPVQGCGWNGDALLNLAKNRSDTPAPGKVRPMTLDQMRALPQPRTWNTGSPRDELKAPGLEGTPVAVTGFLLRAKPEGPESCNCDLAKRPDTDVHLALVGSPGDGEESSVVAEVTPRVRADGRSHWTYRRLHEELVGQFVRITGWLMLDTKHLRQGQLLPNERVNRPTHRATNWEVHPVTTLEVCALSVKACRKGRGWQQF